MKLEGGDLRVVSGVAFRNEQPIPVIRLQVAVAEDQTEIFMTPAEARKIGLDLIGAAHASIADTTIRLIAKEHGLDGDYLIDGLRMVTDMNLPNG